MRVFIPKLGFAINPALSYPRNLPCYCGSGTKYKKCHYLKELRAITAEAAPGAMKAVRAMQEIAKNRK